MKNTDAPRCDKDTTYCGSQQEALTRLLQDRPDLELFSVQCSYQMPAGWFPDHLVNPPDCLRSGWRTWIDIDLLRVGDRGWVLVLPVGDSDEDIEFCDRLIDELVASIDGDLIRTDRLVAGMIHFQADDERPDNDSVICVQSWPELVNVIDRMLIPVLNDVPDAAACERLYSQLIGRHDIVHFVRTHESLISRLNEFEDFDLVG